MPWLIIHQGQFAQNASSWKFWDSIPWKGEFGCGCWVMNQATSNRTKTKKETRFTNMIHKHMTNKYVFKHDQWSKISDLVLVIQQNWFHYIRRFPFHTWNTRVCFVGWTRLWILWHQIIKQSQHLFITGENLELEEGSTDDGAWFEYGPTRGDLKSRLPFLHPVALESLIPSDKSIFKC